MGINIILNRNMGIIGKVVDFDFAAKYSEPGVVAQKFTLRETTNGIYNIDSVNHMML